MIKRFVNNKKMERFFQLIFFLKVTISFDQWKITCVTPLADEIISIIRLSYESAFPGTPINKRFKLKVDPDSRSVISYYSTIE